MPTNPFILSPYSPTWPHDFRHLATLLRQSLNTLALRIDHIGSTSVPNLCSKDVIDIQITIASLPAPTIIDALQSLGYELRPLAARDHVPPGYPGPDSDWDKLFFRAPPTFRPTNTHVRPLGKPNQRYALLFRDYLRAHPAAAQAYAQIKQRLAPKLERLDYIEAKDPVCDLIMHSAESWSIASHWQPARSDA
jgi:GrpB-like predicted nucleotidyltransferase (UPF0157 family)